MLPRPRRKSLESRVGPGQSCANGPGAGAGARDDKSPGEQKDQGDLRDFTESQNSAHSSASQPGRQRRAAPVTARLPTRHSAVGTRQREVGGTILGEVSVGFCCLPATASMPIPRYRSTNRSTASLNTLGRSSSVVMSLNMMPDRKPPNGARMMHAHTHIHKSARSRKKKNGQRYWQAAA
jgi:hypothetical protein